MRRLLFAWFFLLFYFVVPATAAPAPAIGPADMAALQRRAEEAERRAEAAIRAAQIQEAADRLEDAQTQQAYNRFEIWTGLLFAFFSVLITILVLIFGFRTVRVAGIEAASAAQREVTDRIRAIEALSEKAQAATARAEASAQQAHEEVKKVKDGAKALAQASERTRADPSEAGKTQVTLTEAEAAAVKAGAEASPEKPAADLSVDDFRVQVGKAAYLDKDYSEALRLATLMEAYHATNDQAVSFALRHQGDALMELRRQERALGVYSDLISRFAGNSDSEIAFDVAWARYHRGVLLGMLGRDAEAQEELSSLLPIAEQQFGPDATNTLNVRHEYARAMLNQGNAVEAEQEFRKVLPMRERTEGPEHSYTLIARHELARAILRQGRAKEAVDQLRELLPIVERVDGAQVSGTFITRCLLADAILQTGDAEEAAKIIEPIPPAPADPDWLPRNAASLAFIRGRIADALGRNEEATDWLVNAQSIFAALYPRDHPDRLRVETYLASREQSPAVGATA